MTPARLLLPALLLIAGTAAAETQYITDQLSVTLRANPVGDAKAVGSPLVSGNPVDVLQRSPDGKWVRVRFQQVEGWLPANQLQATQGARDRLQELQSRFDAASREQGGAREQLQAAEADRQALRATLAQVQGERDAALQQLGDLKIGAAGPQQISAANQALNQRITELKIDNEKLAAEAARLADDQRADFLLYGALIVFGGMLAGWLTARQSGRRSSGW
ncbi:MAG: TIGR04211 family SH3 domain-containing protein [Gammaproteobacteria bacterium]